MKLSFESIEELKDFLEFCERFGAKTAATEMREEYRVDDVAHAQTLVATAGAMALLAQQKAQTEPVDKPKRGRRPKAEIAEAALAVAVDAAADIAEQTAATFERGAEIVNADTTVTNARLLAEIAAAQVSIDDKPDYVTVNETSATAAIVDAVPVDLMHAALLTDVEHLRLCRDFIGKHGMPKYTDSFARVGLDTNIMGFSAADRMKHVTVLQQLAAE